MRRLFLLSIFFLGFWFPVSGSIQAFAAENISVTPQILRLDLSKDAPVAVYSYKNNTRDTIELSLSLQDFKDLGEQGTPSFFAPVSDQSYKYGLASWATLSTEDVVIAPNDVQDVKVFVEREKLTLGGHYAAILAELKQNAQGNKEVKLKAILASLLFVRAGSEFDREDGKIETFDAENNLFSFPEDFVLRFQNTGNVDVTPYGLVEVTDMLGRKVAKGILNSNSLISLPETIRRYETHVTPQKTFLLPGIYNAKVSLHFGKPGKYVSSEISFFSFGSIDFKGILAALLIIAVAILLFKFKRGSKQSQDTV